MRPAEPVQLTLQEGRTAEIVDELRNEEAGIRSASATMRDFPQVRVQASGCRWPASSCSRKTCDESSAHIRV